MNGMTFILIVLVGMMIGVGIGLTIMAVRKILEK